MQLEHRVLGPADGDRALERAARRRTTMRSTSSVCSPDRSRPFHRPRTHRCLAPSPPMSCPRPRPRPSWRLARRPGASSGPSAPGRFDGRRRAVLVATCERSTSRPDGDRVTVEERTDVRHRRTVLAVRGRDPDAPRPAPAGRARRGCRGGHPPDRLDRRAATVLAPAVHDRARRRLPRHAHHPDDHLRRRRVRRRAAPPRARSWPSPASACWWPLVLGAVADRRGRRRRARPGRRRRLRGHRHRRPGAEHAVGSAPARSWPGASPAPCSC